MMIPLERDARIARRLQRQFMREGGFRYPKYISYFVLIVCLLFGIWGWRCSDRVPVRHVELPYCKIKI
jgi:hypothetical protein